MPEKIQKLTALIPTFNNEDILEGAIRSVLWADEILIIDSISTDNTTKIAKKYGARVIERKFTYHAEQKNWAIPQASHEWIIVLDTDEIITKKLAKEIKNLLANKKELNKYDGYGIPRKHFFLGKFMRWGGRYPLYNIRLFKRSCRYEDRDVHEHVVLPKKKMRNLKGNMLHYSDRTIVEFFEKFERYTTKQAEYLLKIRNSDKLKKIDWKEFLTNGLYAKSIIKDVWFFIPMTSFGRFVYMYIARLGFLDGKHGLLLAVLYSLQDYTSKIKYLKLIKDKPKYRVSIHDTILNFCRRAFIQ